MSIKNSEFRAFAQSAKAGGGVSPLWLIAPLLILLPAGGFYAWHTGLIDTQKLGLTKDKAVAPVPVVAEARAAPAVPAPSAPVAAPAPGLKPAVPAIQQPIVLQAATATPAFDVRAANEALARGIELATRDRDLSLMWSAADYVESIDGAIDKNGRARKVVSPNDVFAYCVKQTEGVVSQRFPDRRKWNGGVAMVMTSEVLLCGLRRGGKQLCQPKHKDNLGKQMTFYLDLREKAVSALASDRPAQTLARQALTLGAHREIRDELKKLASQGIITTKDFGLFTPSFISETIGEHKAVKSSCAG